MMNDPVGDEGGYDTQHKCKGRRLEPPTYSAPNHRYSAGSIPNTSKTESLGGKGVLLSRHRSGGRGEARGCWNRFIRDALDHRPKWTEHTISCHAGRSKDTASLSGVTGQMRRSKEHVPSPDASAGSWPRLHYRRMSKVQLGCLNPPRSRCE